MSRPSTSAESDVYDDGRSEAKDAEQGANDKANVERLDHITSIAMRPGSVILPPEPAKPSPCRSTAPTTPPPSSSPPASSPTSSPLDPPMATSIHMPGLANLILHSPSATIVGTPFALDTDIQRFEYPFPDTSLALPGLYEYNNTSSGGGGSSGSSGSGGGRLGVPALSHSSSSGSSGSSSSASTSCTSSAAPSPSHPPSQTHQHHDPHHPQHQLQQHPQHPQHSQHTHQHVHIVSRHATHPIHIAHIAHPHTIPNHPLSQSPPGSAFPLALTSSLTSPSAKSSHPSHPSYPHAHTHSHHSHHHAHSHPNSTSHTHSTHHTHTQHHSLSPTASALLADSDREEPPVPPGLLKKHRWSLGLLSTPQRTSTGTQREGAGRQRRSATADHARRGDKTAHTNDVNDGAAEYFDVSPGSCTSESSSCSAASDALHALHISDSDTLQGSDTEPSKLGEEGEDSVVVEAVDLTARSALVG